MANTMNNSTPPLLPDIDCVVIGVNTEATLERCLQSIKDCDYPREKLHLIYVDGGSSDSSVAISRAAAGVQVISLGDRHPTPGRGRNAGWRVGDSLLVQFLDSDTILEPDWLTKGVQALGEKEAGAVQGYRKEMHPDKSVFNWITSLEWNGQPGEADAFGGDVLVRREVLEETGGYDDVMVGGEDPELSQRVRDKGWRILQLDTVMTCHDIAMFRISQYWKRAFRSGYGFAAVIDKGAGRERRFWFIEFRRILVRGGGSLFFLAATLLLLLLGLFFSPFFYAPCLVCALVACVLLFWPRLLRVQHFKESMQLDEKQARIYAWHCSLVVIPDILGVIRYYLGKATGRHLRNNPKRLKTGTSGS
ncbi:glycosyltransferase [Desulforhopalus vacuolatus]|uniref:glycosyltransferase n=1 Tax=Desulforhopalus vacuolatus TaxID=40414 RepID=UPI001966C848|nr:glycosyltransferase [Desulforhopalus vacuolatus]MBM9521194.1 glycosyltransferase [Desulforhopalus vacuolatus]